MKGLEKKSLSKEKANVLKEIEDEALRRAEERRLDLELEDHIERHA